MRRYIDDSGAAWDVVLGRESWGTLYALFIPVGAGRTEPVRQALLASESYEAAQLQLAEMSAGEIAVLFSRSTVKEDA